MEGSILLFSEAFSPTPLENPFAISLSQKLWREIVESSQGGRSFLRIQWNEKEWIAPLGDPVTSDSVTKDQDAVYLPHWMIRSAGFEGCGEEGTFQVLDNDAFPHAEKLVLKVVDSAFYDSEVKAELELALSSLGVVRKHSLLELPVYALGGFHVEVFVSHAEPADTVLCEGDEVVVEFEEPVDHYEAPKRPPTPIPPPPMALTDAMLPMQVRPTGFVPFQGQGHVLGGSDANAPAWRKALGPPRQP